LRQSLRDSSKTFYRLLICVALLNIAWAPAPAGPQATITYSANPAPAGDLVITATFDRPLAAAPFIHIRRPGARLFIKRMTGAERQWSFTYNVQSMGGLDLLAQSTTVTISGARDLGGKRALPFVDRTLYIHAPDAGDVRDSLEDLEFDKYPDPVLLPGDEAAWDAGRVSVGDVLKVGDAYWMYYTGYDDDNQPAGIGLATSPDGVTWTKHPEPLIVRGAPGEWDAGMAIHPAVLLDGGLFHMWYMGMPEGDDLLSIRIGHTTSQDGIVWERATPDLAPGPAGAWDEERIGGLDVVTFAGAYYMYYAATSLTPEFVRQIGCAYSHDVTNWTRCDKNPVLSPKSDPARFEGNEVEEPDVALVYGTWVMAYSGYGGRQGANFHIGLARSWNGDEWKRLFKTPAIEWGAADAFDAFGTGQPSLLLEGNELWMWYTGFGPDGSAIGLAKATLD
jgi:predicted GH43/DUF377 family glycosyl hydrolase